MVKYLSVIHLKLIQRIQIVIICYYIELEPRLQRHLATADHINLIDKDHYSLEAFAAQSLFPLQ